MDDQDNIRNMSVIAHVDHGKSTLSDALVCKAGIISSKVAGDARYTDTREDEKERGITINTATLQYETETRHYAHVDCPGHIDYVKNMITGAAKMDAGILVVSAVDGPMPQTKEHVLLCRQIGVGNILIFMNKMDLIKETDVVDLIEL